MGMFHPHERVTLDASGDGRTKQSFAEESNINLIMKKYEKTGMLDHLAIHEGRYGDFIGGPDYHQALSALRAADEAFLTIPAGVRARFDNDPAKFLTFVQDPDNLDEMIKMGLAKPPPRYSAEPGDTPAAPGPPAGPPEAVPPAAPSPGDPAPSPATP